MTRPSWLAVAAVCPLALAAFAFVPRPGDPKETREPPARAVAALGRLEPASRVVRLAATMMGEGQRVHKLQVREGDRVAAGAVIAYLDAHDLRQAAVAESQARVDVCKAKLAQVKAGARPGDIAAREAIVEKLKHLLDHADEEYRRMQRLVGSGGVSRADFDQKRSQRGSLGQELRQAENERDSVREVRAVDVDLAAAEVRHAEAGLMAARAQLDLAILKAPFAGQVLKVNTWPGERVSDKGVVELGDTARMDAVAEVYETDVRRVRVGQAAQVRVPALGATLAGTVEQVGLLIGKKDVHNNDPVADTDARVVEVRVRLGSEDGAKVAGLTNLRVEVVLKTGE